MPLLYSVSYLGFTLLYYAAGGVYHRDLCSRYIYDVIDWSDPAGTGRLVGVLVIIVIPVVYLLLFGVYACRVGRARAAASQKIEPQANQAL